MEDDELGGEISRNKYNDDKDAWYSPSAANNAFFRTYSSVSEFENLFIKDGKVGFYDTAQFSPEIALEIAARLGVATVFGGIIQDAQTIRIPVIVARYVGPKDDSGAILSIKEHIASKLTLLLEPFSVQKGGRKTVSFTRF